MYIANVRKVGGSVESRQRLRYTIDELVAQCDPKAPRSEGEREWLDSNPVGGEFV